MKLNVQTVMTGGALAFAAFALWYIKRAPQAIGTGGGASSGSSSTMAPLSYGPQALTTWQDKMVQAFNQTTTVRPEMADQLARVGIQ